MCKAFELAKQILNQIQLYKEGYIFLNVAQYALVANKLKNPSNLSLLLLEIVFCLGTWEYNKNMMSFLACSLSENIITSNKLLPKPLLAFDTTDQNRQLREFLQANISQFHRCHYIIPKSFNLFSTIKKCQPRLLYKQRTGKHKLLPAPHTDSRLHPCKAGDNSATMEC